MSYPKELLVKKLKEFDSVPMAHEFLLQMGYQFVGYHGTSEEGAKNIVPDKFNHKFIGTGSGTARGYGFYVSFEPKLAHDYKDDEQGKILRIYVQNLSSLRLGVDCKWGLQSTAGDPNGELDIQRNARSKSAELEMILNPCIYNKLIALPSAGRGIDQKLDSDRVEWPPYTIDEQTLDLLGNPQTFWFPPPPLKRTHSGTKEWTPLQKWVEFAFSHLTPEQRLQKGLKYYHGQGTEVNMEKALQWFLTIQENPEAQAKLGDIYENGRGTDPDLEKAIMFYRKAHEGGNVLGTFSLAYCYERGKGVPKNLVQAHELYQIAQNRGYEAWPSYFSLFKRRYSRELNVMSADQLSPAENYQRGLHFYHGDIEAMDMNKAQAHFELAATHGHAGAQLRLGDIYEYGRGIPVDLPKALAYYRSSAALGDVQALYALGKCYEEGIGVPRDLEQAFDFFTQAYNKGYEGHPGDYQNFVRKYSEVEPFIQNGLSRRRFLLHENQ